MTPAEIIELSSAIWGKFEKFDGAVLVESLDVRPWASLAFSGAQHHLSLILFGDGAVGAAADFLGEMTELDLPVPGHFVADIALLSDARHDDGNYVELELELLTIAED